MLLQVGFFLWQNTSGVFFPSFVKEHYKDVIFFFFPVQIPVATSNWKIQMVFFS